MPKRTDNTEKQSAMTFNSSFFYRSGVAPHLRAGLLCLLLALTWGSNSWAQAPEEQAPAKAIYLPLKPPFVVNYGGQGRLKYMKASVSVRVANSKSANTIRHHMPYIRNNLILLFSKQNDEDLDTQEGKELLRQAAMTEISAILEAEEGESGLTDLFFNQLVIQK
jgi:flagellar FliL protein